MRLDELIEQTTIHEKTVVAVDRRVTVAGRTALACCAASTAIYNQTKADDASNLVGFIVDWFGFPTAGFIYTITFLIVGSVLGLVTKGFTEANQQTHQIMVAYIIAAAITAVPIIAAVVVWVLFIVLIVALFTATIGFVVLVLWALTQAN